MQPLSRWLCEGVHIAAVGPDLVVLSLRKDAYFCLAGAASSLSSPAPGRIAFADEAVAAPFEALGLVGTSAPRTAAMEGAWADPGAGPPARAFVALAHPSRDLCDRSGPVGGQDRVDMARAFGAMATRYVGRSLWSMVRRARDIAHPRPPAASEALIARTLAFQQLLPWAPFQGQCLYRGFMLLTFLRLAGLHAHWVFGVRTWPFQAHCWLQAEDLVLDDAAERVGAFTPILVV